MNVWNKIDKYRRWSFVYDLTFWLVLTSLAVSGCIQSNNESASSQIVFREMDILDHKAINRIGLSVVGSKEFLIDQYNKGIIHNKLGLTEEKSLNLYDEQERHRAIVSMSGDTFLLIFFMASKDNLFDGSVFQAGEYRFESLRLLDESGKPRGDLSEIYFSEQEFKPLSFMLYDDLDIIIDAVPTPTRQQSRKLFDVP